MSSRLRIWTACFAILPICAYLPAQAPRYRIELSDQVTGWLILVNDSEEPIEAFFSSVSCGLGGTSVSQDTLDFASDNIGHPPVNGVVIHQGSTVQPGQRFFSPLNLLHQPSGCVWHVDTTAVIYSDGSYGGEVNAVRALQARRQGLFAALQYWAQRLHQPGFSMTPTAVAALGKALAEEDFKKTMFPGCHDQPLACAYWQARDHVDRNMALQNPRSTEDEEAGSTRIVRMVDKWLQKIEHNAARKKLEAIFPLPPD